MRLRVLVTLSVTSLVMTALSAAAALPARAGAVAASAAQVLEQPAPSVGSADLVAARQPGTARPATHAGRRSSSMAKAPTMTPLTTQSTPSATLGALAVKPPVGSAPPNPTANILPSPAFPDDCYFAPGSTPCSVKELAALNHARAALHQPAYVLPANFSELAPAAKLLLLSNSDRALYGLEPVLSLNATLNAVAQQGAVNDFDPTPPDIVSGQSTNGWSANWAGGIPTVVQAYYEWMFDDGLGSNNIDCTATDKSGCWGHRMDTLFNFGSAQLHMGFGSVTNDPYFAWSFSTVYWANGFHRSGTQTVPNPSIPFLPVVTGSNGKQVAAGGGTTITVVGAGFTGASRVRLGAATATPTLMGNNRLTFRAPAGLGVQQITVTGTGGTSVGSSAGAVSYLAAKSPGSYIALTPARLLDTRSGIGAARAKVAANGTIALLVSTRGGVPATGVSSVVLNVTAVTPSKVGYVTVYPHGRGKPNASNINFQVGQTTSNSVFVPIGPDGKVSLTNSSNAPVDLLTDVMGYVVQGAASKPGAMVPLSPTRLLDTRVGIGAPSKGKLGPNGSMSVVMANRGGVPASGVSAVIVNITAVTPKSQGYITAWGNGAYRPDASTINLRTGQSTPNLAVVPVGAGGRIALFNGSGQPVDLIVDVAGYVKSGAANLIGGVVAVAPSRLMDTRSGNGIGPYPPYLTAPDSGSVWVIGKSLPVPLKVTGRGAVPESGVSAVILNVTVVNPNQTGSMTVHATGSGLPSTSNVNFIVGQTVPNLVVAPVGPGGYVNFFPRSNGSAGMVVDITGYILTPQT